METHFPRSYISHQAKTRGGGGIHQDRRMKRLAQREMMRLKEELLDYYAVQEEEDYFTDPSGEYNLYDLEGEDSFPDYEGGEDEYPL